MAKIGTDIRDELTGTAVPRVEKHWILDEFFEITRVHRKELVARGIVERQAALDARPSGQEVGAKRLALHGG